MLHALNFAFAWVANFRSVGQFNVIDVRVFDGRAQIVAADVDDLRVLLRWNRYGGQLLQWSCHDGRDAGNV